MRMCVDCRVEKPLDEFPMRDGRYRRTRCRPCYTVYNTSRKNDNWDSGAAREYALKRKYNITLEKYEEMFAQQDGVCAICGRAETRTVKGRISSLAVDHDHACCPGNTSCGACVRGLLCQRCNMMLGHSGDNLVILHLAIKYLTEYNEL